MIIRILGRGQWDVSDIALDHLNEFDDRVEQSVAEQDQASLTAALSDLIEVITSKGAPIADDTIVDSDLIIPDADATVSEVTSWLAGLDADEGLIPG